MTSRIHALVAGVALLSSLGLANAGLAAAAHAAPATDPCAARLPLVDNTSGITRSTLQVGGWTPAAGHRYTLSLGQFGATGQRAILAQFHTAPLPGDMVQEFDLTLPGGTPDTHRYSGLAHAFVHRTADGTVTHICLNQQVFVDHGNSAYDSAHPHTTTMRLDGQICGNGLYFYGLLGHATDQYLAEVGIQMTVQIGARRYVVAGPFTSTYLGQSQ